MGDGADSQRIIANNLLSRSDDVCARCAAFLVLQGTATKPVVEGWLTTRKFRQVVIGAQFLRRA